MIQLTHRRLEPAVVLPILGLIFLSVALSRAGEGGPERELDFLRVRHAPYGAVLPGPVLRAMWEKVQAMPSEPASISAAYQWKEIGPAGVSYNFSSGSGRYDGRILDLEINPTVGTRFAAASGGLWGYAALSPYPMSDQLTSLAVSTFATDPGNNNIIIVGTGEAGIRSGIGIWRTTDAGQTWTAVNISGVPNYVFKIRFDPSTPGVVHAATDFGYARSDDDGQTWTWYLYGYCTDIGFASTSSGPRLLAPFWGQGLYVSTNGGGSWNQVSSNVLPTSDMGRTSISGSSYDPSVSASHIYLSVGTAAKPYNNLNGLYRSDDGGQTWANITPANIIGTNQLWYDNAIAVSPADWRRVIVGWVKDNLSTDGGQTWTLVDNLDPLNHDNTHDDWHVFRWTSNGQAIYAGNDGGLSYSGDGGVTWSSNVNNAPITQFYGIDVESDNGQVIIGGAQDNGAMTSNNGGSDWVGTLCCDAGSPAIDPSLPSRAYAVMDSHRYRSTDGGMTWGGIDNGLAGAGAIRTDAGSPTTTPIVYTSSGANVYYSTDYGNTWQSMTAATPLPAGVADLQAPVLNALGPQVYAIMGDNTSGTSLKRYYQGVWSEASTGLPSIYAGKQRVARVRVRPTDQRVLFAVMAGVDPNADGQKVFKSTNRGSSWNNITGNLPNIPLADIAMDPTNDNNLYVGGDMGCFRTSDGGTTWYRWNDGMPQANIVTELRTAYFNGVLTVVAGTYGRSMWIRDASSSDPSKYAVLHQHLHYPITGLQTFLDTIKVDPGGVPGWMTGVTLSLDTLHHPYPQNLVIVLHHGGVDDTLYNRSAPVGVPGGDFLGTIFDDAAPGGIGSGLPPFTGRYRPVQPLAQFNDLPPGGSWVLDVFDAVAGDTGTLEQWGLAIQPETITTVSSTAPAPRTFALDQNYPNPFNPSTNIRYQVAESRLVRLAIYDILGREIALLVNERKEPGDYEVTFDGKALASGVYFCRLQSGSFVQTTKLMLVR